jgi:hypothetical protein
VFILLSWTDGCLNATFSTFQEKCPVLSNIDQVFKGIPLTDT